MSLFKIMCHLIFLLFIFFSDVFSELRPHFQDLMKYYYFLINI